MMISAAFPMGSTKQCTAKLLYFFLFLTGIYLVYLGIRFAVAAAQISLPCLFRPRTVAQILMSNGRNFLESMRNFYFKAKYSCPGNVNLNSHLMPCRMWGRTLTSDSPNLLCLRIAAPLGASRVERKFEEPS